MTLFRILYFYKWKLWNCGRYVNVWNFPHKFMAMVFLVYNEVNMFYLLLLTNKKICAEYVVYLWESFQGISFIHCIVGFFYWRIIAWRAMVCEFLLWFQNVFLRWIQVRWPGEAVSRVKRKSWRRLSKVHRRQRGEHKARKMDFKSLLWRYCAWCKLSYFNPCTIV